MRKFCSLPVNATETTGLEFQVLHASQDMQMPQHQHRISSPHPPPSGADEQWYVQVQWISGQAGEGRRATFRCTQLPRAIGGGAEHGARARVVCAVCLGTSRRACFSVAGTATRARARCRPDRAAIIRKKSEHQASKAPPVYRLQLRSMQAKPVGHMCPPFSF